MNAFKNISLGVFYGLWDSIRGMTLLLHIDAEMHRINAEKEAERQRRSDERQRHMRRTPSPTPSSASAMAREELRELLQTQETENPDERSLKSLRNKPKPIEEQKPKTEKKIAKQVLKCCLLNGGFTWLSIILFEQILLPVLRFVLSLCYGEHTNELNWVWGWLHPILSIIFGMMWVLPIFLLSKIVSSLWFADIANAAYRIRKGKPQMISSISKLIADFLFSLLVQALFLVQSMLVNLLPLPYLGQTLCFLHLCLLYSLYSFEYKWFNMGWELHRRLSYIENNWPYFLGFGIPLTVLTSMTSSVIVSSCIFSIFFPLFILSGNEAKPLVDTTDLPLRLFSPVIFVSNLVFTGSGGRSQKMTAAKLAQQKQQLLLKQKQKRHEQEILLLEQQMMERERSQQRGRETFEEQHRRRHSARSSHSPSPSPSPYRYQQPPTQPRVPSATHSSADRGRYMSGMQSFMPTSVPGAPTTTAHNQRVHRR